MARSAPYILLALMVVMAVVSMSSADPASEFCQRDSTNTNKLSSCQACCNKYGEFGVLSGGKCVCRKGDNPWSSHPANKWGQRTHHTRQYRRYIHIEEEEGLSRIRRDRMHIEPSCRMYECSRGILKPRKFSNKHYASIIARQKKHAVESRCSLWHWTLANMVFPWMLANSLMCQSMFRTVFKYFHQFHIDSPVLIILPQVMYC